LPDSRWVRSRNWARRPSSCPSFGAASPRLLWLAGAVIDADEPWRAGGAHSTGPAAWDSHPGTKEAARGDTGAADGDDA
jgi:hypothetical protein